LVLRGIIANVRRNNQPTQTSTPKSATIFHTFGSRKRYGWVSREDVYNAAAAAFNTTTAQVIHSRFIISAIAGPADNVTAGDLSAIAADILQHDIALSAFVAAGCNVLRVQDLPAVWFQDDARQNREWASFDITFTHKDTFGTLTPVVSDFNPDVQRITP
jgi:hypothetical protein